MSWLHFKGKMCRWAVTLAPAINSEEAVQAQFRGAARWTSLHGGWGGPFFRPWQEGLRKLFIAIPFLERFGIRLRAWVFTGPIWRQVFQINFFTLSLKDGCPLRETGPRSPAPPPCWFPAESEGP